MTEQEKRKKVIKGLECCKIPFTKCYNGGCPYFENDGCKARLKDDALALLKAQEPVKPNEIRHGVEMSDNNKLRDTILDMEASLSTNLSGYSMWHYGADIHGITRETLKNAIEALKAQTPVVIQFDEIDNYEVLWLEVRDIESEEGLAPWIKTRNGNWFSPLFCNELQPDMILSTPEEYGKFCRCWTFRPDEKRRKETPWN